MQRNYFDYASGILLKDVNGRYYIEADSKIFTWTSSEEIEISVFDQTTQQWSWIVTRIEYATDYFAVCYPDLSLVGVTARRKILQTKDFEEY